MKKKEQVVLSEDYGMNLSDFALFLSVMKNRKAYQSTLSIILDEKDLELIQVHVEQVVLNKSGKRAIRLDAWALDNKNRQFNTEMQNDTSADDVRKRARYYQGLLDTPILKAGKKTKYKELPCTTIIFITQEDIFGKDLAMYTFTEQCEEVEGLHLEDGTTKIFLNMKSKNGRPELVSLLQYMKDTRLDNPEILVQDERIKQIDDIVTEVRQSEEWEEARMNLLQVGENHGRNMMLVEMVCCKLRKGKSVEEIADALEVKIEVVESVYRAAESAAPEYDSETVYQNWKTMYG